MFGEILQTERSSCECPICVSWGLERAKTFRERQLADMQRLGKGEIGCSIQTYQRNAKSAFLMASPSRRGK